MSVWPLLGVVACADVWGFSDLTASDAAAPDAATPQEAAVDGTEGGMDSGPDSAQREDESSADLPDAREERDLGEAGEGGMTVRESGSEDGGDAAADCNRTNCPTGCCDSLGKCWPTSTTAHCGTNGNACEACTASACTLASACCTSKGTCGCQLVTCM
jgi:hypothetical protein